MFYNLSWTYVPWGSGVCQLLGELDVLKRLCIQISKNTSQLVLSSANT